MTVLWNARAYFYFVLLAFSNVNNFSRWLHVSMAVRLSGSIENQGKIWFKCKCTTRWYESRSSYSSVLSLLASFSKSYSIILLGNLHIFGNTSDTMFLNMYNLKIWQDAGLHRIWFSRENFQWIRINDCFHFFKLFSVHK